MSKNGWKRLKPLLPAPASARKSGGRPAADVKEVINAIFYVVRTGCNWRSLPHDFRNRFILTDTQGLLLAVWIWAASVSEEMGVKCLLRYIRWTYPICAAG